MPDEPVTTDHDPAYAFCVESKARIAEENGRLREAMVFLGQTAKDVGDIFHLRPDVLALCGPAEHATLRRLAPALDRAQAALGGSDGKAPPHPATSRDDFWQREAAIKGAALEAARRENIELERHYREALAEITRLRQQCAEYQAHHEIHFPPSEVR